VAAASEAERCQVIVNATTIGLPGAAGTLPRFRFRPEQLVVDYVYGDTAFIAEAARAGAEVVTGEQILVRQGALGFALWTGRPAPERAMSEALKAASRKVVP
jgi:shikimate dehydrogenase